MMIPGDQGSVRGQVYYEDILCVSRDMSPFKMKARIMMFDAEERRIGIRDLQGTLFSIEFPLSGEIRSFHLMQIRSSWTEHQREHESECAGQRLKPKDGAFCCSSPENTRDDDANEEKDTN